MEGKNGTDAWAEEDAAAARNFGWASYVYIGAGPGERSAGGEMMARMFFGGSCTDARRAWPLVVRADCRWFDGAQGYGRGGRSSEGIRWPLRHVVSGDLTWQLVGTHT
jgi:hypothetical protein